MKIYKIKMMSGTVIPLKEDELDGLMKASQRGGLIMTSYGVVNCASIDSITYYSEAMREINEQARMGAKDPETAVLGRGINYDETKRLG